MADTFTPNYGFVLIEIGASRDTWGTKLNGNMTAIDGAIKANGNAITGKLDASAYTAADVLAKMVSVDGAGSLLDADTVDGKHATDFMAATGFTGAAILALLLGVDGSGSGLDADTLDGVDSAGFALAAHTHPYLPIAGGAMTNPPTVAGEGVFPHYSDPAMNKGRMFVSAAAGTDPTSLPGDMWLGF